MTSWINQYARVGWLIILPPGVGWYIMGNESYPLPSYQYLRNWSYYIKLSYTPSLSTLQGHLPRLGPTIAAIGLPPLSALPPCTAYRWVIRPPFSLWFPNSFWCTPRWDGALRSPFPPLSRGSPTLRLPRVSSSSPLFVAPPVGGTPPGNWASPWSPPISCCRTIAPTAPPLYTLLPGTALLFLYFPPPSLPFLTACDIYSGFVRPPPNCCYCRQLSALGM